MSGDALELLDLLPGWTEVINLKTDLEEPGFCSCAALPGPNELNLVFNLGLFNLGLLKESSRVFIGGHGVALH